MHWLLTHTWLFFLGFGVGWFSKRTLIAFTESEYNAMKQEVRVLRAAIAKKVA